MKKLSIIIPVFNEEKTIEGILKKVIVASILDYKKEIIIVNDGSTDNTRKILKNLKQKINFVLVEHSQNLGKGSAIKTALKYINGDYVIIQDADLEYEPNDYEKLLKISAGQGIVYGSRKLGKNKKSYFYCDLGVKFLTWLINFLFGSNLTDVFTCYKLIPAEILKSLNLQSSRFEIEAEITAKILKRGYKIKEVAINYSPRSYQQGKKIRVHDGLKSIWTIIANRFRWV